MKKILVIITAFLICCSFQKNKAKAKAGLSDCIKQKIAAYEKMEKHEQPQNVIEYMYKGKKVYYVTVHCCDFYNELYDSNCVLMGHPDGGFTGKGDGKIPDFEKEKSKEKIIWKQKQ